MRRRIRRFVWFLLLAVGLTARAQPVALSVNPSSREEVRQFYQAVYGASENVPMRWSGSYATGQAGDTAAAFREATRLRINFYRALAGVPADIVFNPLFNTKAQQSALLMSVNNTLSHNPPASWPLFSADAAEGARNSNLALGIAGPAAIDGYMADAGLENFLVGHRRWLLYPQTLQMGTGDVPGVEHDGRRPAANAVWVLDIAPGGQFGAPRPATRTGAVAYPPDGFVPYPLVWPRWSISHPDADFSSATVAMTRNGQRIPVEIEPSADGLGEPTLVWIYDHEHPDSSVPHERPAADTHYAVIVDNVQVNGTPTAFFYTVTVFDPAVPGRDFSPTKIAGSALPGVGKQNRYTVAKPTFASGFDWRTVRLTPTTRTFTAESGLEGLEANTTAGYALVQSHVVATGSGAYRLAHSAQRSDQILKLPGTYFVSEAAAALALHSRLAIATDAETARIQISTNEGVTWSDLFRQTGTSPGDTGFPAPTETAFTWRRLSLEPYLGRTVQVRLVYSIGAGPAFRPEPANAVGWFIDNITLSQVELLTADASHRVTDGASFDFLPTTAGVTALQARPVLFDAYPSEWGPVHRLNALEEPPSRDSYLSNLSVRGHASGDTEPLIVGFSVSGGTKPVLVRGIGPGLGSFGISGVLSNPLLELFREKARIAGNDDWDARQGETFRRVGAFSLDPGSRDAALVVPLAPSSYTAQVSGAQGAKGIALVELYDTTGIANGSRLANVSARSQVGTGSNALIAGFTIAGSGPRRLLLRAIGPTLASFGVAGAVGDPKLELYRNGAKIAENDNWPVTARSSFESVGAFDLPTGSRDSALLVTLPPGNYTAQVTSNGAGGAALIEIYDVP